MWGLINRLVRTGRQVVRNVYRPPAPRPAPRPPAHRPPAPRPPARPRPVFSPQTAARVSRAFQAATRFLTAFGGRAATVGRAAAAVQNRIDPAAAARERQRQAQAHAARVAAERARIAAINKAKKQAEIAAKAKANRTWIAKIATVARSFMQKTAGNQARTFLKGFEANARKKGFTAAAADVVRPFGPKPPQNNFGVNYNAVKEEYRRKAVSLVDQTKRRKSRGWLGNAFDNLTFGDTRRAMGARTFADQQYKTTAETQVKRYEETTKSFIALQAAKKSAIEKAKFRSWTEYNNAVADFTKWENSELSKLEYARASTEGLLEGYGVKASEKLATRPGKVGSWLHKNVAESAPAKALGSVWKYTLGAGSETTPSLVTAPSRAINYIGNKWNPNRTINEHGGKVQHGVPPGKNAWTATYNQRNLNWSQPNAPTKKEWIDATYNSIIKSSGESKESWLKRKGEAGIHKLYTDSIRSQKYGNYAREFAADPLMLSGLSKSGKFSGYASKLLKPVGKSGFSKKAGSFLSPIKNNKVVKWLGAEHKNHAARKNDFVNEELDDIYTKKPQLRKLVQRWQAEKTNIKVATKTEISNKVLSNFSSLSKKEIKSFQQYHRAGGDWSAVKKADKLSPEKRRNIEELSKNYKTFLDDLQKAENKKGIATPFKENYLPQYRRDYSLFTLFRPKRKPKGRDLWFTKQQKDTTTQSKKQLINSLSAREYASKSARQDFPVLRDIVAGGEDFGRNIDRIENVDKYVKKTRWEKAMAVAGAPTRAWKKTVLLGNPAWYVNNELFNQIQGVTAGGLRFLKNQRKTGKYLEHVETNARKRMSPSQAKNIVADIGSNVNKEIGTGKLARFASRQESRSRIALYRTFRQRGMSHEEATKRVNDNLFNYTTKNYERPLKTLYPFYAWNKGLAKASIKMPFQKPRAALAFNQVEQAQKQQFDRDFEKIEQQLRELGYTEEQIAETKEKQYTYFKGKFKFGENYYNTPFNAFSERGLSGMGVNPWIGAAGEAANSVDHFGNTIRGAKSDFTSRVFTKTPQTVLAEKALNKFILKPMNKERWIGAPGSSGYGMTKESQGFDPSKENYQQKLDPAAKFDQDFLAFLGVPRKSTFDTGLLLERKTMEKLKQEYFATDWNSMEFADSEKKQAALFKKYGMTADSFYKGELSKYDSDHTKAVKKMKEEARALTKQLYDEYGKQPKGTRGVWATKKLKELNAAGYFDKNPFLKSFDWTNPGTIAKAYKKMDYDYAKSTGDWSKFNDKYGKSAGILKKEAYQRAKASGDWTEYNRIYGKTAKATAYAKAKASGDWTEYSKLYGKTAKATAYAKAKASGDWTEYTKQFGSTVKASVYRASKESGDWTTYTKKFGKTAKATAYAKAKASGDWTEYTKQFGSSFTTAKKSPFKYEDKFFKSKESMEKYKKYDFWNDYANASRAERKRLLADNPHYNERKDWTTKQWDDWKAERKAKLLAAAKKEVKGFSSLLAKNIESNKLKAAPILYKRKHKKPIKLAFTKSLWYSTVVT